MQEVIPRILLIVLFVAGIVVTFTESVYLQDQYAEIGEAKIALWMWVFRGITLLLLLAALFLVWNLIKRML